MKFTRVYEDETSIETWTYDTDKFSRGPISVDIKYKGGFDTEKKWIKMQKEAQDQRRIARKMKKINKRS